MSTKATDFREHFNDVADEAHRYAFFVRAIELQEEIVRRLESLAEECVALKNQAIATKLEFDANAFLSFELMARALRGEFQFYISLKRDDINKAWDHLIDAQQYAAGAMKAHEFGSHLEPYIDRLYFLEQGLFPTPAFFSSGYIVKESHCSICGSEYGECDHIKGRTYMGKLCSRVIGKAEMREVSVVSEPADKHCRVFSFTEGGVERDAFTFRVINFGKTTSANTPNNDAPPV